MANESDSRFPLPVTDALGGEAANGQHGGMPLCFDLDGTLGHFDGGYALLRAALGDLWGQEPTADELRICRGSTDWEIVDELHRGRFGRALDEDAYAAYGRACLARFREAFATPARVPVVFPGMVAGLNRLAAAGWPVWVVSGNEPAVLAFKALALGVDPAVPRLGSLPRLSREGLIRHALKDCPGPHLYVGDRPHDRDAARAAGVPFLGVGAAVPGDHVSLAVHAEAEDLLEAIARWLPGPPAP